MKHLVWNACAFVFSLYVFCVGLSASSLTAEEVFPALPNLPVVAHRGFSEIAPENTLASMRAGIEVGAFACEMDIHQTADGVLFLNHDGNFKRTSGVNRASNTISIKELQELDAGAWKGENFKGERYPTFDQALDLLAASTLYAVVELKEDGIEEKVIQTIRNHKMEKRVVLIDFSAQRVKNMRHIAPDIPCAWLVSFDNETSVQDACQRIETTLRDSGTNLVDMHYAKVCPELLERLEKNGIEVMVWTVDNPQDIDRLYGYGVKSITTDRPDFALDLYQKHQSSESK